MCSYLDLRLGVVVLFGLLHFLTFEHFSIRLYRSDLRDSSSSMLLLFPVGDLWVRLAEISWSFLVSLQETDVENRMNVAVIFRQV